MNKRMYPTGCGEKMETRCVVFESMKKLLESTRAEEVYIKKNYYKSSILIHNT